MSTLPCTRAQLSADSDIGQQRQLERAAAVTGDKFGVVSDGEAHTGIHRGDCLLIYDGSQHCEDTCVVTDLPATYGVPS